MSDLSEFEDEPRMCSIARHVSEMEEEDRARFIAALAVERYTHAKFVERFAVRGIRVSKDTVSRHRQGKCRCVR